MASFIEFEHDIPSSPMHQKVDDMHNLSLNIDNIKFMDNFDILDDNMNSPTWTQSSSTFLHPSSSIEFLNSKTNIPTLTFPISKQSLVPLRPSSPLAVTIPFDFPSDNALSSHNIDSLSSPTGGLHREQSNGSVASVGLGLEFTLPYNNRHNNGLSIPNKYIHREVSDASLNSEYLYAESSILSHPSTTTTTGGGKIIPVNTTAIPPTSLSSIPSETSFSSSSSSLSTPKYNSKTEILQQVPTVMIPSVPISSYSVAVKPVVPSVKQGQKRYRDDDDMAEEDDDDDEDNDSETESMDENEEDNEYVNTLSSSTLLTNTANNNTSTTSSSTVQDPHNMVVLPLPIARSIGRKGGRIPYPIAYRYDTNDGKSLYPENTLMIGIYSYQHRIDRLQQWNDLRNRRIFYKKVKYRQRRILANGRQRVKGRFVKEAAPLIIANLNPDNNINLNNNLAVYRSGVLKRQISSATRRPVPRLNHAADSDED